MIIELSPLMKLALETASDKKYGKGSAIKAITEYDAPERIPSGSLTLDFVLGGGIPRGRVTIFRGEESFGKSTLATMVAAYVTSHPNQMKKGGLVVYIDVENTYDPTWAAKLGLDTGRVALIQPKTGEQALDTVLRIVRANVVDLIIYDSIAATALTQVLQGETGDNHVGLLARKLSQNFFPALIGDLNRSDTALLMINQTRLLIGVTHGDPESQPGGKAPKFYASINMKLNKRPQRLPEDLKKPQVGMVFSVRTSKNKTAQAGRTAEITLSVVPGNFGVSIEPELAALGKDLGVFRNKDGEMLGTGNWFFEGEKVANGADAVALAMAEDAELCHRVETAVRKAIADGVQDAVGSIIEEGDSAEETE